jgi:hypothetical protein
VEPLGELERFRQVLLVGKADDLAHPIQVRPRAERFPGPGQDDDADGVVRGERPQGRPELSDHPGIERVVDLGPVEPDPADLGASFDPDRLVGGARHDLRHILKIPTL